MGRTHLRDLCDATGQGRQPQLARGFCDELGWEGALLEIEHQAEHWATPDHGEFGQLIAEVLRAAIEIAREGGLDCEHRASRTSLPAAGLEAAEHMPPIAPLRMPATRQSRRRP